MLIEALWFFSLLRDTKEASEAAFKAANAYKMIVKSINTALNASNGALDAAMEAIRQVGYFHVLESG